MKKGEKIMNRLQQQKENKSGLLEDMLSFIRYTPNREADLLAFMEKYQKADCDERPAVLEQLRRCMDGKEYPDPYAGSYHYTPEDVSLMGQILDDYIDALTLAQGDPAAVSECVRDTVLKINALNEECGRYLIDTWRRERLCGFINSAAELAGLSQEKDLTQQHRMW
ncbi:hypothetical protein [Novisyntrophococcus fermenticellae]|jgi:hypothetical protein|uniref:hypothetical protein n=2 Tax=Bacillota TaxID=1239 RepID=UPI00036CD9C8|nr:hypothetical protein [Novisyntrophococcus fermenticellae]